MMRGISTLRSCATLCLMVALLAWNGPAGAAKASECTKIGVCFCVNQDLKITIDGKVANFRQLIVEQHKKGKAVGYLSVPLSPAGGGYMKVNMEVAENAKAAVEKRFGADFAWILNPGTVDANLPGGGGSDYMLMWTSLLEGPNGLGEDFDFVYFVGPQDFARYFELDGTSDMTKIDQFYDKRLKSDPEFEKATQGGLTRSAFRNYYALKASSSFSRGSHDEWNIIRLINERRRADNRLGVANQLPVLFDGRAAPAAAMESPVSEGYVGKCAP